LKVGDLVKLQVHVVGLEHMIGIVVSVYSQDPRLCDAVDVLWSGGGWKRPDRQLTNSLEVINESR
jgi:hypothetical protein